MACVCGVPASALRGDGWFLCEALGSPQRLPGHHILPFLDGGGGRRRRHPGCPGGWSQVAPRVVNSRTQGNREGEGGNGEGPVCPRVVDGDTVELRLTHPLPAPLGSVLRLRVKGVDSPELRTPKCSVELQGALRAQAFTTEWVTRESEYNGLFVSLCGWDKYGLGSFFTTGTHPTLPPAHLPKDPRMRCPRDR